MEEKKQRLSKYMANAGVASRRACEEIIFAGRVQVNGEIALLPQTPVSPSDTIFLDGEPVGGAEKKLYFILNKPRGYICSAKGNSGSRLVLDLFQGVEERLFTIGRLDKDTEGLLLVTNDGHFAHRVIHPSSNIHKEYLAKADQEITPEHLKVISKGTWVGGAYIRPIKLKKVRKGTLKLTIAEGKKHEVRLLLEAAGLTIQELRRIRIGGLILGSLPVGSWRPLEEQDIKILFNTESHG